MKNDRKYTFTPNKISSKIPVDIKNMSATKERKSTKRESKENLHFVDILQKTNHGNFPKINLCLIKNTQKTTSLRDILIKNVENTKTKNENVSPSNSPRDLKKSLRAISNFSKNVKNLVEESKKDLKHSVSVEKNLEKNKSVPPKHFNISLVYTKNSRHVRKFSEGYIDNFESNNVNERSDNKGTKTTKDTSFTSLKINNQAKGTNLEVESIEELHFIYNNLYQQNKALAFKFENQEFEEEINEDQGTIYIN